MQKASQSPKRFEQASNTSQRAAKKGLAAGGRQPLESILKNARWYLLRAANSTFLLNCVTTPTFLSSQRSRQEPPGAARRRGEPQEATRSPQEPPATRMRARCPRCGCDIQQTLDPASTAIAGRCNTHRFEPPVDNCRKRMGSPSVRAPVDSYRRTMKHPLV